MELIRAGTKIDFVRHRNTAAMISGLVILAGVAVMIARGGFNLGIDFAGGTLVQVRFNEAKKVRDVRKALAGARLGNENIQDMGRDHTEFLIRVSLKESGGETASAAVSKALREALGGESFELLRVESVGPRVGETLREKAVLAVLIATLMMGIYIAIRFEWRFGVGAAVALFHDVLVTVGFLVAWNYEFDLTIVAALLTVVGFSVNDTVIVSDRIRENMRKDRRSNLTDLVNRSINETLSRTVLTTGTSVMVVASLYTLGGNVIHGFAFTLLVGFLVGTYSSIYIASPVVLLFESRAPTPGRK